MNLSQNWLCLVILETSTEDKPIDSSNKETAVAIFYYRSDPRQAVKLVGDFQGEIQEGEMAVQTSLYQTTRQSR